MTLDILRAVCNAFCKEKHILNRMHAWKGHFNMTGEILQGLVQQPTSNVDELL